MHMLPLDVWISVPSRELIIPGGTCDFPHFVRVYVLVDLVCKISVLITGSQSIVQLKGRLVIAHPQSH